MGHNLVLQQIVGLLLQIVGLLLLVVLDLPHQLVQEPLDVALVSSPSSSSKVESWQMEIENKSL